jgi:hypothetical protein
LGSLLDSARNEARKKVSEPKVGSFEGWALVEIFGHQKEVGFVTTEAYGTAVLFRCDTPELPEREYTLESPEYAKDESGTRWCPTGTKVRRQISPAKTRLIGPGAIYSITPCTEDVARRAIEEVIRRPLILLEMPKGAIKELLPGETVSEDRRCEDCGEVIEECLCEREDEDVAI